MRGQHFKNCGILKKLKYSCQVKVSGSQHRVFGFLDQFLKDYKIILGGHEMIKKSESASRLIFLFIFL